MLSSCLRVKLHILWDIILVTHHNDCSPPLVVLLYIMYFCFMDDIIFTECVLWHVTDVMCIPTW